MTKPYHITPEQALEIAKQCGLDIDLIDTTGEYVLTSRDSIYLSDLQGIINAALDKVLGDPVADAFIDNFGDLKIYPGIASKAILIRSGGNKLYAPRREK